MPRKTTIAEALFRPGVAEVLSATDAEKRAYIRKDQSERVEWRLKNRPLDQAVFHLLGRHEHDNAAAIMTILFAAKKNEGLTAEQVSILAHRFESNRKRAGL